MSGHSRWAQIKRKKAVTDAKRGNVFSKFSRIITVAAKASADRQMNPALRIAIARAREINMPADNIERAIQKAAAAKDAGELHEVVYEAYAPGGSALLIEGITDNKNRTAAEIKHIISEAGGKTAGAGAVSWMFEKRGVILLSKEKNQHLSGPEAELRLIEAGADDVIIEPEGATVIIKPELRETVGQNISHAGFVIEESTDGLLPKVRVKVPEDSAESLERLIAKLEEHDDVQNVWSNHEA